MSREPEYLSDESLELLIAEVELNELVAAPPELRRNILDRIEAEECAGKKKELYQYCFRVITSMAAAVIIIFALPHLPDIKLDLVIREKENTKEYSTEEDIIFGSILGETRIFGDSDKYKIFR